MKRSKRVEGGARARRPKGLTLRASAGKAPFGEAKRRYHSIDDLDGLYRPLKKPVTLRLDADVLAWFKKEGRRYQTRINRALREFMERKTKEAEE